MSLNPLDLLDLGSLALGIFSKGAEAKAKKAAYEANKKSAIEDLHLTYADLEARKMEEGIALAQQRDLASRTSLSSLGIAQLSAAESGVAGGSVTAISNDVKRGQGEYNDSLTLQNELMLSQMDRTLSGAESQARSRIAGVEKPNAWATGLSMAGMALDTTSSIGARNKWGGG